MSKKLRFLYPVVLSVIVAVFMTYLSSSNLFLPTANKLSDALYQQAGIPNENIVVIGMDERASATFGTMPWTRDIMATAIENLNADPEKRPAVIGIDTLYTGASAYPQYDSLLAEACGRYGNVVTASTATFGDQLVTDEDGSFYMDNYAVLFYEESFPELLAGTEIGHINAMIDDDGILRHAIWQLELEDGRVIPSFNQTIYKKYMEYLGQEATSQPPVDPRQRWYVPFSAAPFAFDSGYSLVDVVNGTADPDVFAGKIVLIGPFTQGMSDEYTTAVDHATKMYGVEYQANAIAALIEGELKTEVLQGPQTLAVFVITLVLMLWFYDRDIKIATIVWIIATLGWVGLCMVMWNMGYVLQVVYLPIASTISYIVCVAINYTKEALEKRRVTNTFRRYVAPQIVTELLNHPEAMELGGEMVDIAVLFVDIRGFTTMSEALDPVTVVEIVNKYLTLTSQCIFDNNGTLDKFVGDCTMAFWGAPIPQEDVIYKAVKTAMDMVEQADKLGIELKEKYGHEVHFGVGVHYGPAVVGNIGSPQRMDYTAIGDTVNTAARLESNAPKGTIYVSRIVADSLSSRIKFTSLGNSVKLKGKSDNFEVLKVEGYM